MKAQHGNTEVDVWQIDRSSELSALPDFVVNLFEKGKILWQQNFFGAWTLMVGSNVGTDSAIEGFWLVLSVDGLIQFVTDKKFQKDFVLIQN
ncbi:MAG: hypothetical protein LBI13_10150 [Streptococcaceae bacterium]|jgi:hypothetical protein|nr:hypothetical protein [Streptococcaceae bacterium]